MPKRQAKKSTEFQTTMTKAAFLTGYPNKAKLEKLRSAQDDYTKAINMFISLIDQDDASLRFLAEGNNRSSYMRQLEKANRPSFLSATFSQAAFDDAFVKLANRVTLIRKEILSINYTFLVYNRFLFGMILTNHTKEECLAALQKKQSAYKKEPPEWLPEQINQLSAMTSEEFDVTCNETRFLYRCSADGHKVPYVKHAEVRLVSTNMKFELTDRIKADAVISISIPSEKGYIDVPLITSSNSVRRMKQHVVCHSAAYTVINDKLRVSVAYQKSLKNPACTAYNGVDVGISDALHSNKDGAIGSLRHAIEFYKTTVEVSFAERSMLRNKKAKLIRYLHAHPDVPDDVKVSIYRKIDRLEAMLQKSHKAYRKNRQYHSKLRHEIRQSVDQYIESLHGDKEIMTVLELLDMDEFKTSSRENGRYSMFARGLLSETLMSSLNWHGYSFIQVAPEFTSQTCPVCGHVSKENRHNKEFKCLCCGHEDDADHVGSINIERRATDDELLRACEENKYNKRNRSSAIRTILDRRHEEWVKGIKITA